MRVIDGFEVIDVGHYKSDILRLTAECVPQVRVKATAIEYPEQPISASPHKLVGARCDLLDGFVNELNGVLDFQIARNRDLVLQEDVIPVVLEIRFERLQLLSNRLTQSNNIGRQSDIAVPELPSEHLLHRRRRRSFRETRKGQVVRHVNDVSFYSVYRFDHDTVWNLGEVEPYQESLRDDSLSGLRFAGEF